MKRALVAGGFAAALVVANAAGVWASEVTVRIVERVEPPSVTVPPGGIVTWHNADDERHRVRATTGPATFDSGNLEPSRTWSQTFSAPGVYRYVDARNREDEAYWGSVTVTAQAAGDDAISTPAAGGGPISMPDRSFSPASVTVPAGTTVTWMNDSDRDHTVTADDGSFDSGTLPPGAGFTHTFDQDGSYGYFCALHGGMRGTVVVGDGGGVRDGQANEPAPAEAPAVSEPHSDVEGQVRDFAFEPAAPVPAGWLALGFLLPASVLFGVWRIERALRRLASPPVPPGVPRPPGRS